MNNAIAITVEENGKITLPSKCMNILGITKNDGITITIIDNNRFTLEKAHKIEEGNQLTIPKITREILEIKEKDILSLQIAEDKIILNKCGSSV